MIQQIFMMGLVFGMCLSANFAARQWGGCDGVPLTLDPGNPCEVVMAAVNCTLCMVMLYFMYRIISSGANSGGSAF